MPYPDLSATVWASLRLWTNLARFIVHSGTNQPTVSTQLHYHSACTEGIHTARAIMPKHLHRNLA